MNNLLSLLRETLRQWDALHVTKMGAALSFYTVFSLAPLAITRQYGGGANGGEGGDCRPVQELRRQRRCGGDGDEFLSQTAAEDASVLGTLIGFGVLLIGASGVFGELQESLNQIWGVSSKRHPVFILVKERVFSFAMVFVMGFLMLVSFLFSAAVAAAGGWLHARFPGLDTSWNFGNAMISVVVIAMLFALIYRMVPDARIAWRDVWLGAVIAAVLFEVGKFLLGFYFGRSAIASSYGAAGSLIIILVWVFYSAQILFFGAAFTRVYALRYGSHSTAEEVA